MGNSSNNNSEQFRDFYSSHQYIYDVLHGDVEKIYASEILSSLNPKETKLPRESCDSSGCPNSRGVMIIIDDTSSMNGFLTDLIQKHMKDIAITVPTSVNYDPQILFGVINDIRAMCNCPLQIGQFEAGFNEMIDQLTSLHIQGGGGGNGSESYIVAQYFAAYHTRLESLEKRGEKGILFIIGDDGPTPSLTQFERETIFGDNNIKDIRGTLYPEDVLAAARRKYHVYQIFVHGYTYSQEKVEAWRQLLDGHLLDLSDTNCITELIIAVLRMYDGKTTKSEALSMISDSRTRKIVSEAMKFHSEKAEPDGISAADDNTEIEEF